jgi:hypothetical protein
MTRRRFQRAAVGAVLALAALPAVAPADTRVTRDATPGSYVRYDGATDPTMQACSTGHRTQNEPSVAVHPANPDVVVAGSNDYCAEMTNGIGNVWGGYYRSSDGGQTWTNSLVPGYPADASPAGRASPTQGVCAAAGDPTQAFDAAGRLYYGFICFNRAKPTNGGIYVARYDDDGARYVRTTLVEPGTPSVLGLFQDKINLAVDQSTGQATSGNVYVAWARYSGGTTNNVILFSRSTDGGVTWSRAERIANAPGELQFTDIGIGPDGAVYVTYRSYDSSSSRQENAIHIVRSTDGGASFGEQRLVARIDPFDSTDFGPDTCGDGPFVCASGLTYARFSSQSAVAADAAGVHVTWSARDADGQAKIFVRNSPDGITWSSPTQPIDTAPRGHQWFPDIASASSRLSVVFQDSRADPSYSSLLPPGNTATGANSGPVVQTFVASSADGGGTWSEAQVSTAGSNPNWEVRGSSRSPFFGDYNYVSATGGARYAVWTDTRDLVPGTDPRGTAKPGGVDTFDGAQTCAWVPNDINAPAYSSPSIGDPCLSAGGLDQNIYVVRLP